MSDLIKTNSTFAAFVAADIKGGAQAHAFRKSVAAKALEQAFKGNYSPLAEALALSVGKAKKARAWAAGLAAAGVAATSDDSTIRKVPYVGKLELPGNAEARELIVQRTASALESFSAAFEIVMAEKAAPKAKTASADGTGAPASGEDQGEGEGEGEGASGAAHTVHARRPAVALAVITVTEALRDDRTADTPLLSHDEVAMLRGALPAVPVELSIPETVDAIVQAMHAGMLSDEEITLLRAALAVHDAAAERAPSAVFARLNPTEAIAA